MKHVALLFLLLAPASAFAHRLDADYVVAPDGIHVEFFFADGRPGSDLAVTARQGDETPIALGTTDDRGAVRFMPPTAGEWTLVGKGAGGHSNARHPLVIPADDVARALANRSHAAQPPMVSADPSQAGDAPPPTGAATATQAAPPTTSRAQQPERASLRGRFPWVETTVSLAFIAALTLVTLWLMRRSARYQPRSGELDRMARELDHLRTTVRSLEEQIADLKARRDA